MLMTSQEVAGILSESGQGCPVGLHLHQALEALGLDSATLFCRPSRLALAELVQDLVTLCPYLHLGLANLDSRALTLVRLQPAFQRAALQSCLGWAKLCLTHCLV